MNALQSAEKCFAEYKKASSKDGESPFDAIIIDYLMPEKDGATLAKEILTENPNQKIIFVSAHGNLLSEKIKKIEGDVELISKPVSMVSLAAKLEGVTEQDVIKRLKGKNNSE